MRVGGKRNRLHRGLDSVWQFNCYHTTSLVCDIDIFTLDKIWVCKNIQLQLLCFKVFICFYCSIATSWSTAATEHFEHTIKQCKFRC